MPSPRDQRPYNVSYYARNREAEIERVMSRQRATLVWLRDLRRDRPCHDCAGVFPPHVMQFDHRDPATKRFNIMGSRAMLAARPALLAEIAKCDVVCTNCHRVRTTNAYANGVIEGRFKPSAIPAATRRGQWRRDRFRRHYAAQVQVLDRIRGLPCQDCARCFPKCAMEFDHRDPSQKRHILGHMAGHFRIETLLSELAKCDIVCANCHADRTYHRRECDRVSCVRVWCSGYAREPSKFEGRVRFPSPAQLTPTQLRLIEESRVAYRAA